MAWFDDYFTSEWERIFRGQARKIFANNPDLVEDAFQSAWTQLLVQVKKSSAKEVSDAYVMTQFKNLLRNEYRKQFGRCRVYEWVKRLGSFWDEVAKYLCHDKLPPHEIVDKMCSSASSSKGSIPDCRHRVEDAIQQLKQKPFCPGLGAREIQPAEDWHVPDHSQQPGELLAQQELELLFSIILGEQAAVTDITQACLSKWDTLNQELAKTLTDEDRLILRLMFIENYTVEGCATALNKAAHVIRYQRKNILSKLCSLLSGHGVSLSMLAAQESVNQESDHLDDLDEYLSD